MWSCRHRRGRRDGRRRDGRRRNGGGHWSGCRSGDRARLWGRSRGGWPLAQNGQLRDVADRQPIIETLPPRQRVGPYRAHRDLARNFLATHRSDRDVIDRNVPLIEPPRVRGQRGATRNLALKVRAQGAGWWRWHFGHGRPRCHRNGIAANDDLLLALAAAHPERSAGDLFVSNLVLRLATRTKEFHRFGAGTTSVEGRVSRCYPYDRARKRTGHFLAWARLRLARTIHWSVPSPSK